MNKATTLILTSSDVNTIMMEHGFNRLMDDLINRLSLEFKNFDKEKSIIPIRSGFNYTGQFPGLVEWMPIHKVNDEVVIKIVGYHPKNPKTFNLPTILSSISSYDTRTGHLKGLVDGVLLTALRTGAASALASKYLASPESSVLGLIGCGAQSVTQLHAISRNFKLQQVLIFDKDKDAMISFESRIRNLNLDINVEIANINYILENCDIVCTATSIDVGEGPLFKDFITKPHLHINAVGSDFPGKIELPLSLLKDSFVSPDFVEQAKIEGESQQLEDIDIGDSIITISQNSDKFEYLKKQRTVFDSTGLALEDKVVMGLFLELADKFNVGTKVRLENISTDVRNPYHFLEKHISVKV
ncbi:ornithine cyclodeaminase [Hyunsoonleella jejuensis]|uniref:Ornithine cyclodeaminase n=1 Tax=Hyunsoonleella jejuensis TaxID=419940 RepID=A0A1H9KJ94_9FLAO|nr:ornithine cyclodeaminase family protein [Hyunsoonleella jejuensis]SEQ99149.1 ornithine cyclodeaminase [Hyunsoonleella jejuensis]